jgi:EAL domain-containing protein (putative c-di-GMP-specific phosphodiesterase class I)
MGLAASFGMTTVAEGVETEEQLAALRDQGCARAQGYLFSPPVPGAHVAGLIRTLCGRAARIAELEMETTLR